MELGGVGSIAGCPERGWSRSAEARPWRGLGTSTEAVWPARAMAMLEVAVWGPMISMREWWQPVINTCQRVRVGTKEDGQVRNQINKGIRERREMLLTAQRDSRI